MQKRVFKYLLIICSLSLFTACKSTDIIDVPNLENEEYELEVNIDEFIFKNKNDDKVLTKGSIKTIDKSYFLKTYDSIVSDDLYFEINEAQSKGIHKDSLRVIINAPIEKGCYNGESNKKLPFLISVSKPFLNIKDELKTQKKSFLVTRESSYNVFIYPQELCNYPVSLDHLSFIFYVYSDETNQVEINLPDLTYHRFGYLNIENAKLTESSESSYILKLNGQNINLKLKE
ncbi:hypothetical protein [Winogradskyella sp.]|uniref:hypothetical protein n=1 Tax=Winogradskyella sp. TaxID=1883156 RepID=UPI001B12BF7F|nr:hypothetical protein [Winogradskyella sp.]MBO6878961.1 hypothetical protein [Winogradskyella sp.]